MLFLFNINIFARKKNDKASQENNIKLILLITPFKEIKQK